MTATRIKASGTKIKFSDDGEAPEGAEIQLEPSPETTQQNSGESDNESEDSDDSDEAPEEESVSQSKAAHLQKVKENQRRQQEARKQEKEKRKQQDLQFRQQQELKREKLREMASAEELPDFLPEEALESDEEDEDDQALPKSNKHLRSEDFEKEDAAMRKKAKLEKLKNLKEMRQSALKKGPVYVQVQSGVPSKNRVPRAEQSVLDSKSQWMQRESLNRK